MNKESLLREARTTEAMRKGYMGLEGKLAVIAKRLGSAIVHQNLSSYDQNLYENPFFADDLGDGDLPTIGDDDNSMEIGVCFNGLSSGLNMTITVRHDHRDISCEYDGRKVYHEISGDLERFAPDEAWESKVEALYGRAKQVEARKKPQERRAVSMEADRKRRQILEEYKDKWGLT